MDDAVLGVSRGSCLLSKENATSLSDYGPCTNLSNAVSIHRPAISPPFFILSLLIELRLTLMELICLVPGRIHK